MPRPEMLEVESSNLKAIGYDPEARELYVDFLNNSSYVYLDVPQEIYDGFLNADSKGKYLHRAVKLAGFEFNRLR